ncbi:MAG: NAD(P)H-dependent oxidoreductase [Candidatus Bipolaricaulota bacterium]
MQLLVLYYSGSGNTKRLAEAVAEGAGKVEGFDVMLRTPEDITMEEFKDSHAIVAGSPVYFGGPAAELKKVFDDFLKVRKYMEGKIGAAFAASAHHTGGKETTMLAILQAMLIYGMIVLGDPLEVGGHYGVACAGTPDEHTLEGARKLGARVAETANKLLSQGHASRF